MIYSSTKKNYVFYNYINLPSTNIKKNDDQKYETIHAEYIMFYSIHFNLIYNKNKQMRCSKIQKQRIIYYE